MSVFGHGSFKQAVLDDIESQIDCQEKDRFELIEELVEVFGYLYSSALHRDEVLEKIREEAKEEAKRELINQIK